MAWCERKVLWFDSNFTEVCSWVPNWQWRPSIALDNGLVPNRQQAIIWTNADLTHICNTRGWWVNCLITGCNMQWCFDDFLLCLKSGCCGTFFFLKYNVLLIYRSLFSPNISQKTPIAHPLEQGTVYPKKYAQGFCFAVLCCGYTLTDFPISTRLTSLALWQSNDCPSAGKATLMNMDKYFMWNLYERLHNHNKAKHNKTVCIFIGIYCMIVFCEFLVWPKFYVWIYCNVYSIVLCCSTIDRESIVLSRYWWLSARLQ